MAAQFSSTGTSHHNLLPHIPLIHLSAVNSSPCPGIALQSLNSSSQQLCLPGDLHHCPGYVGLGQGLSDSHSIRLPQISCFTLSLKCFCSDSDSCPNVEIGRLLQFSHLLMAGQVLLTLLLFPLVPLIYQVLHDSVYSFPLLRYSCPLPAGVLHIRLCVKVYS